MSPTTHRPNFKTPEELERDSRSYGDFQRRFLAESARCPEWALGRCRANAGECVPCEVREAIAEVIEELKAAAAPSPSPSSPAPRRRTGGVSL
jgi:hypothetical protein